MHLCPGRHESRQSFTSPVLSHASLLPFLSLSQSSRDTIRSGAPVLCKMLLSPWCNQLLGVTTGHQEDISVILLMTKVRVSCLSKVVPLQEEG